MSPSPQERAAALSLERLGFERTRFLAPATRRSADLLAWRAGLSWAVELRHSSRPLNADASFEPDHGRPLPYPTLESYFALLWAEKRGQLEASAAAEGCERKMLLVCADGAPGPAWTASLRRSWQAAGSPARVHFALLAGSALLAFPPLP